MTSKVIEGYYKLAVLYGQVIEIPRVALMDSPRNILLNIMFSLSTSCVPGFQFASLHCMGASSHTVLLTADPSHGLTEA